MNRFLEQVQIEAGQMYVDDPTLSPFVSTVGFLFTHYLFFIFVPKVKLID